MYFHCNAQFSQIGHLELGAPKQPSGQCTFEHWYAKPCAMSLRLGYDKFFIGSSTTSTLNKEDAKERRYYFTCSIFRGKKSCEKRKFRQPNGAGRKQHLRKYFVNALLYTSFNVFNPLTWVRMLRRKTPYRDST